MCAHSYVRSSFNALDMFASNMGLELDQFFPDLTSDLHRPHHERNLEV